MQTKQFLTQSSLACALEVSRRVVRVISVVQAGKRGTTADSRHGHVGRSLCAVAVCLTVLMALGMPGSGASAAEGAPSPGAPSPSPSTSADRPDPLARFSTQTPGWTACGNHQQCASIEVPLSYLEPEGATVKIALRRAQATGSASLGSIVINPGGPGASGTGIVESVDALVPKAIRKRYDIVGVDPRGVGSSTRLVCLTAEQVQQLSSAPSKGKASAESQLAPASAVALGCKAIGGALVGEVGTPNAARDLDIVRAVLGEERLNYIGISYGTYLGAVYAQLFPTRVGRTLLDAGLSPSVDMIDWGRAQVSGFQGAFKRWASGCSTRATCSLQGSPAAVQRRVVDLLAELRKHPLPAQGGRPVDGGELQGLLQGLLPVGVSMWPGIDALISAAEAGDSRPVRAMSKSLEDAGGTPPANLLSVNAGVNCYDRPTASTPAAVLARASQWEKISPIFGRAMAITTYMCANWPVRQGGAIAEVTSATEQPILLIGGTKDPLTPYSWTQELARAFTHSRVLTFDGEGHGALGKGSACIDRAVTRYFLDEQLPAAGSRCR